MPYITKKNSVRIINQVSLKDISHFIKGEVYKNPIYFFNNLEKNKLLVIELLFKDPTLFITEYYKPIIRTDKFHFVYEGNDPAYHYDSKCQGLNSNFINFEIPEEIKERGENEVIRFREWFHKNRHIFASNKELFVANLIIAFEINSIPNVVEYNNSGVDEKKNFSLEEIESKIDQVIKDSGRFYNQCNEIEKELLRRFQKHTYKAYKVFPIEDNNSLSDVLLKQFLQKYDTDFKKPLQDLLIDYYRIKHNPNLKFEGDILEKLGFRPCTKCYTDEILNRLFMV